MTQAKAQTVASALIAAGYVITVEKLSDNTYTITATGADIDPGVVDTFATNQAVTATISEAKFS